MIHEALDRDRRADSGVDQAHDLDVPIPAVRSGIDTIADDHRRGGLGRATVDAHVPGAARTGGLGA